MVQFEKLVYYTDSGNVLDYKRKAAPTSALMKSDQPRRYCRIPMAAFAPFCYYPAGAYCRAIQPLSTPPGKRRKKILCRCDRFCNLLYSDGVGPNLGGAGHDRKNTGRVVALAFAIMALVALAHAAPGFRQEVDCAHDECTI